MSHMIVFLVLRILWLIVRLGKHHQATLAAHLLGLHAPEVRTRSATLFQFIRVALVVKTVATFLNRKRVVANLSNGAGRH